MQAFTVPIGTLGAKYLYNLPVLTFLTVFSYNVLTEALANQEQNYVHFWRCNLTLQGKHSSIFRFVYLEGVTLQIFIQSTSIDVSGCFLSQSLN